MQRIDRLLAKAEKDIKRAVITMLSLKLRSGASPQEMKKFVSECLAQSLRSYTPKSKGEMVWLYEVARILRTWHLETEYLTEGGGPKPLKLGGKRGLRSLILCHFPPQMVNTVFATMRRNGLIKSRRAGYWTPTSRYARTPKPTVELLSHFAEGVSRLAETVGKNLSSKKAGNLLLERAAQVCDLPISEAQAFRRYAHSQGMAYLTAIDDWLETRSRKAKGESKRVCHAGVFTFAFIDDELTPTKRPSNLN